MDFPCGKGQIPVLPGDRPASSQNINLGKHSAYSNSLLLKHDSSPLVFIQFCYLNGNTSLDSDTVGISPSPFGVQPALTNGSLHRAPAE
jgi:hypothetical protein